MLNRRWPRNLTARVESLRRLIDTILTTADEQTGVVHLDLGALKVPVALRIDVMRDLVTYNYFLPFAPAQSRARGREKKSTYGRPGVLAPLVSWIHWEKAAPFSEVVACVSPPIQRLLAAIKASVGQGDALSAIRIPGKHAPRLYKLLSAQEKWPATFTVPELREAVLGPKRGSSSMHKRLADFLKYGLEASVVIINKYSDLRVRLERVFGVAKGHHIVTAIRFERE